MRRIALILAILIAGMQIAHAASNGKHERKMKVRITSPKPGQEISGTLPVMWEVTDTGRPDGDPPPAFVTCNYYVDTKYAGVSRSTDPPFELDTTRYSDGKHLLTINVIDDENRIGTTSIWVKVVNEQ